MSELLTDGRPPVDTDERARQTVEAYQEAQASNPDVSLPSAPEATPAEMTPQDEADLAVLDAAPEAVEPEYANPVSNANVLDLRAQKRAEQEVAAKARVDQLQKMADAGEPVVTAEALDRQAAIQPTEAPKKKGLLSRFFGGDKK